MHVFARGNGLKTEKKITNKEKSVQLNPFQSNNEKLYQQGNVRRYTGKRGFTRV